MTAQEVLMKLRQKVNKNFTNDNIAIDAGRAYFLINEALNKFVEWTHKKKDDDRRDIQLLLVDDKKLELKNTKETHNNYKLPENHFLFSNLRVKASQKDCKNKALLPIEIKDENRHLLDFDIQNEPSFYYRETFYNLSENNVKIYKKDFEIDEVKLSYYRYPKKINFSGFIMADGTPSVNQDPEFDDRIMDRVISIASKDFNLDNETGTIQVDQNRIISNI